MKLIQKAVIDLYGDWHLLPDTSQAFIENVMEKNDFEQLYRETMQGEHETKELLALFEKNYPGVTKEKNINGIAENLQKKAKKAFVLAELRKKKTEIDHTVSKIKHRTNLDLQK